VDSETAFLVIVSRNRPDLYASIRQLFFTDPRYQLMFDRRRAVRRRKSSVPLSFNRRGKGRRVRPEIDEAIRVQGWAVVSLTEHPRQGGLTFQVTRQATSLPVWSLL
jgi:hypothetical protein